VSAFGKAAYENNAHTFELWKQFLNELTDRLDKLEQKNAASFHSAMDDYRERFIEANAEAIKSVQSDIVARLSETQGQLNELTKQTNELGCMIVDICDKIDVFIQGEMDISEERHSNMKKMIDNKLETNNRYTENIRDSIYNLTETIDETIKIVSQNSENYNKAIQLIQENQERMNSLAQEDITILKGLLK
jgi:ABC-type transporter Mla subunit MlaD